MTTKTENLRNPPAIEAVFDIAVQEDETANASVFSTEEDEIKKRFPLREEIKLFEGAFQIGGGLITQSSNRSLGYLYKSEDGKELIQFRTNGYSYNKLAPYKGWSEFLNSALTYWEQYRKIRPTLTVARMGLRFINILNFPSDVQNKKLFNVSLKKPSKSDFGKISDLGYRFTTEFPDHHCSANVQFGRTASRPNTSESSYIFDIDVYSTEVTSSLDSKTLRLHFSKMRTAKNSIFFSTLTDEALKVFK